MVEEDNSSSTVIHRLNGFIECMTSVSERCLLYKKSGMYSLL